MIGGVSFLLGIGMFFAGCAGNIAKQGNSQISNEQRRIYEYYRRIRSNDDIYDFPNRALYAPYIWPKYVYYFPSPITWSMLASCYGESVHDLQMEYLQWRCMRDGMPFDLELANRAYGRRFGVDCPEKHPRPKCYWSEKQHLENKRRAEEYRAKSSRNKRRKHHEQHSSQTLQQ